MNKMRCRTKKVNFLPQTLMPKNFPHPIITYKVDEIFWKPIHLLKSMSFVDR